MSCSAAREVKLKDIGFWKRSRWIGRLASLYVWVGCLQSKTGKLTSSVWDLMPNAWQRPIGLMHRIHPVPLTTYALGNLVGTNRNNVRATRTGNRKTVRFIAAIWVRPEGLEPLTKRLKAISSLLTGQQWYGLQKNRKPPKNPSMNVGKMRDFAWRSGTMEFDYLSWNRPGFQRDCGFLR